MLAMTRRIGEADPLGPELGVGDVEAVLAQAADEGEDGLLALDRLDGGFAGHGAWSGRAQGATWALVLAASASSDAASSRTMEMATRLS